MGQILNRIFRIAKSNLNNSYNDNVGYYDEVKDLKRIIDELDDNPVNQNNGTDVFEKIDNNSAYLILKIDKSAGIEEIKSAYKRRIKEYHPDRLQNFGEEIRNLANIKTKQINLAYSLIKEKRHF